MQVTIGVTRSTQYCSIVEMTKAEYKRLSKDLGSYDRSVAKRAEEELNSLINVNDWQDDSLDDIVTFEPFKPTP